MSYVIGQLEDMAMYLFDVKLSVKIESLEEAAEGTHAILQLAFHNEVEERKVSTGVSGLCPMISSELILQMFPFHMLFRKDLVTFGIGESLIKVLPDLNGKNLADKFDLIRPAIALSWDNVSKCFNLVPVSFYMTIFKRL